MLSQEKKTLMLLMAAIFFVALAYSLYFQIEPSVDAQAYDRIAWNLVEGNGYKEKAELSYDEDIAILRVGPGYEFFLAGIYAVFGHHIWVVWFIHALLSALTAFLVFLTTKEIFKSRWSMLLGIIAAAFVGFSPDLVTINGMLMTETLGVFLIAASVYVFFRYVNSEDKAMWRIIVLALLFGAAVLVRTPVALLFIPFAGYLVYRRYVPELLVFCAVLFFVFTPWTARNYEVYGTFIPTNLAFGYDLLAGNHSGATGELEPYAPNEEFMSQGRIEGNKLALKTAINFIMLNPVEFLKITLERASIYFSFARPTGFWFHLEGASKAATLLLSALYSILLFVFGFWGIYRLRNAPPEEKERVRLLALMLLMMPLAIIGIIVETRYRFLAYPIFAIFASYGILDFWERRAEGKAFIGIAVILFANTAFDALRNLDRIRERIGDFFS